MIKLREHRNCDFAKFQRNFAKIQFSTTISTMTKSANFTPNLKKSASRESRLAGGHRLCPGCGIGIILKQALSVIDAPIITANATGCSEICFGAFPYSAFRTPWIHSLFENSASVISGVEAAKKSLERRGKLTPTQKKIKFLALGGDGASYDIGFQWLSGAIERGHDFVYICFDNEGYMNTGYQQSGATPAGFATATTPLGKKDTGKLRHRKNLTKIIAAHDIPFAAQANPAFFSDLAKKVHRAFEIDGPAFINCFSACPTNWKFPPEKGMEVAKLATESNFWPLFEVDHGKWKINFRPRDPEPKFLEFCKMQGRTKHLPRPENSDTLAKLNQKLATDFAFLEKMEKSQF